MSGPLLPIVLLVHGFTVYFMTGLIWVIQLVHYPLMSFVARDIFSVFHAEHSTRITWIVAPMMLLQLGTGAFLAFWGDPLVLRSERISFLFLTLIVFATTAVFSIPAHGILAPGFHPEAHHRLVITNWSRTAGWSLHSLLLLLLFHRLLSNFPKSGALQ